MTPEHNQDAENRKDKLINDTLAVLRRAEPPAGMASRISARLAQQPAAALESSFVPSATWWRGALTGAAFAALALCAFMLIVHPHAMHSSSDIATAINRASSNSSQPITRVASTSAERHPCPMPTVLSIARKSNVSVIQPAQIATVDETSAPSRPAPVLPLTAQERQLTHLIRNSDPRQLAALGLEQEARLEVEKSTGFSSHSATVSAADSATPQQNPAPEAIPQSAPDTSAPQQPAPEQSTHKSSTEEQI